MNVLVEQKNGGENNQERGLCNQSLKQGIIPNHMGGGTFVTTLQVTFR